MGPFDGIRLPGRDNRLGQVVIEVVGVLNTAIILCQPAAGFILVPCLLPRASMLKARIAIQTMFAACLKTILVQGEACHPPR